MGLVKLLEMVIALRSAVFVVFILFNPDQTALGIGKGAIFSENTILKKMQPILIQLLDYPCTRVVTVVNASAIKKGAPGEDAGSP